MRGLDIVRSGLRASERSLYVTAHNLSNANTEGYKRQRVEQVDSYSSTSSAMSWGDGVNSSLIRRMSNEFVDNIYRREVTELGEIGVMSQVSGDLESILGEPILGKFSGSVNGLWSALNTLSRNPSDNSAKSILIENAKTLVDDVNSLNNQLTDLQKQLDQDIKNRVVEINEYAKDIARLNKEITRYEIKGDQANDLRDQRDLAIDRLSGIIDIEVYEPNEYMTDIYISGTQLVSGEESNTMLSNTTLANSMFTKLTWSSNGNEVVVSGGELKGLIEARGSEATGSIDNLKDGNVNDMVDLVFAIDTNMTTENLEAIKNKASAMIDKLDNKQLNYKLYFNIIGTDTVIEATDRADFETKLNALAEDVAVDNNFLTSFDAIKNIELRENSSKYLMLISDKAIQGDGADATITEISGVANSLNSMDMKVITVSDEAASTTWNNLANRVGGDSYGIDSLTDEENFFADIADGISKDINISVTEGTNELGIIPSFKEKLNGFINVLMREINSVLRQGYDNYGRDASAISLQPNTDEAGNHVFDLFIKSDKDGALQMGNISINTRYLELNNIAVAGSTNNTDTAIAQRLLSIRNADIFASDDGGQNIDEFFEEFILDIGNQGSNIETQLAVQNQMVTSAYERKQGISGVSMDEELSNMIKFQQAYSAASKYLTTLDEMLDVLILRM